MLRLLTTALVCSSALAGNAAAQEPLSLVITPTRTLTLASQTGNSISVITAKDMERLQIHTVSEALKQLPGLSVSSNGSSGQTTSVFIRGAKSEHTLVLVDGVEVNDPASTSNSYDFSRLTTDNIERIEVLRGSQSVLYGTDAIGGVINIITRKGSGATRLYGSTEAGSHHSYKVNAGISGAESRFGYSAQIATSHTGGVSAFNKNRGGVEKDGSNTTSFSTRIDAKINEAASAYTTLRYTDQRTEFDDFGSDAANIFDAQEVSTRTAATLKLLEGKWEQELGVNYLDIDSKSTSWFGPSIYAGNRTKVDWVHTLKPLKEHTLTAGMETEQDRFHSNYDSRRLARNYAAFLQDQWIPFEDFYVTAGGRADRHEEFGTERTYRIAPTYFVAATDTRLKASYGTGFKALSLFQLYSVFGNRDLQPEASKGWDAGFEQSLFANRVQFGSTYFRLDIEDLIDYDFATDRYINTGKVRTQGIENSLTFSPFSDVRLMFNHTFTLAEDKVTSLELLRRPRHTFAMDATWQATEDARLGANLTDRGAQEDIDFRYNRTHQGGYPLLNLNGDWRVIPDLTLFGRVENLLNREYENVYGYGTFGTSVYVGMRTAY